MLRVLVEFRFEILGGEFVDQDVGHRAFEGLFAGNSSRILFNLGEIRQWGEVVGAVAVHVGLAAAVGLENTDLAEGGVIGAFPALVVAAYLFEIGFVLFVWFFGDEDGFVLLALLHLPVGGDQAAEGDGFEWAIGFDFVSQFGFDLVEIGPLFGENDDVGCGEPVLAIILGGGFFTFGCFGSGLAGHGMSSFRF